VDSNRLYYTF